MGSFSSEAGRELGSGLSEEGETVNISWKDSDVAWLTGSILREIWRFCCFETESVVAGQWAHLVGLFLAIQPQYWQKIIGSRAKDTECIVEQEEAAYPVDQKR